MIDNYRGASMASPVRLIRVSEMGLKESLLGRLGSRGNKHNSMAFLSGSLSSQDKLGVLVDLVDQTVLPRRFTLRGENAELNLRVANKRLFDVSGIIANQAAFKYTFAGADQPPNAEEEITRSLTKFFEKAGPSTFEFTGSSKPEEGSSGLEPKSLLLVPQKIPEEKILPPKDTMVETADVAGVPLSFLEAAAGDIRKARHYSFDTDSRPADPSEHSTRVKKEDFSSLNDLHAKFSPILGKELLFVAIAEGVENDAFAFAINGEDGVTVEMDCQKIGTTYRAWRNAKPV